MLVPAKNGYSNRTDDELIAVVGLDDGASNEIFRRYYLKIFTSMNKYPISFQDREDLTLEAFEKAFIHHNQYIQHTNFSAWLYKIVRNNALNLINGKKRLNTVSLDNEMMSSDPESCSSMEFNESLLMSEPPNQDDYLKTEQQKDLKELLNNALDKIGIEYSQPIRMNYFNYMTYEQIAEFEEIPLGTAKSRISRGKEKLRKEIGGSFLELLSE